MPHAVKNQCDHLVEVYGPAIVEILSRDIDPKDVCTLMQLCNSQETGTYSIFQGISLQCLLKKMKS